MRFPNHHRSVDHRRYSKGTGGKLLLQIGNRGFDEVVSCNTVGADFPTTESLDKNGGALALNHIGFRGIERPGSVSVRLAITRSLISRFEVGRS
jgi:hypothetical protein